MKQSNQHIFIHKRNDIFTRNRKTRKKSILPKSSFAHYSNFDCFCLEEDRNAQLAKEVLITQSHFDAQEEQYESFRPQQYQFKTDISCQKGNLDFITSQNKSQKSQFLAQKQQHKISCQKRDRNVQKHCFSPKLIQPQQSPNLKKTSYQFQSKKSQELKSRGNVSPIIFNKSSEYDQILKCELGKKIEEKEKKKLKQKEEMSMKVLKESNKNTLKHYPQYFSLNHFSMSFTPNAKFIRDRIESSKQRIINNYEQNLIKKRRTISQTQYLTNLRNCSFSKETDEPDNQQLHFKDNHMKSFSTIQNERGSLKKNYKKSHTFAKAANIRQPNQKNKQFRSTTINSHTYSTKSVVLNFIDKNQKASFKEKEEKLENKRLKWINKIKQREESTKSHSGQNHLIS